MDGGPPVRRPLALVSGSATPVLAWLAEPVPRPTSGSRPLCAGGIGLGKLSGDLEELLGRPSARSPGLPLGGRCLSVGGLCVGGSRRALSVVTSTGSTASGGTRWGDRSQASSSGSAGFGLGPVNPMLASGWGRGRPRPPSLAEPFVGTSSGSRASSTNSVDLESLDRSCSRSQSPAERRQAEELRHCRLCFGLHGSPTAAAAAAAAAVATAAPGAVGSCGGGSTPTYAALGFPGGRCLPAVARSGTPASSSLAASLAGGRPQRRPSRAGPAAAAGVQEEASKRMNHSLSVPSELLAGKRSQCAYGSDENLMLTRALLHEQSELLLPPAARRGASKLNQGSRSQHWQHLAECGRSVLQR